MNPVTHFEMPYDDADRVASFYKAAFGWKMNDMGQSMGHYVLATTTATGPDRRPLKGGTINGGFFPKKPDWPAQYPSVVIAVSDLVTSMTRITAAGGTVMGEPMDIPGVGGYVSFTDSEGNRVGMLQPLMPTKPAAKAKPKAKAKAASKPKAKAASKTKAKAKKKAPAAKKKKKAAKKV